MNIGATITINLDKLWNEGGTASATITGYDASGYLYATFDTPATWYGRERKGMALAPFQMKAVAVTGHKDVDTLDSPKLAAMGFYG